MAQRPRKKLGHIHTQPAEPTAWVRTGAKTAAPSRFTAWIDVPEPGMQVALGIALKDGDVPVIEQLAIWPGRVPITPALLRKISLDQLVRAAVRDASATVTDRRDVAPGAFQLPAEESSNEVRVSIPPGLDERVLRAARLYKDAVNAGSQSPAADTAGKMHLSREHTARYIRRARAAGLLPSVRDVVSGKARQQPLPVSEGDTPPGWTPMRHLRDLGDPETWMPDDGTPPDRQTGRPDSPANSEKGTPR